MAVLHDDDNEDNLTLDLDEQKELEHKPKHHKHKKHRKIDDEDDGDVVMAKITNNHCGSDLVTDTPPLSDEDLALHDFLDRKGLAHLFEKLRENIDPQTLEEIVAKNRVQEVLEVRMLLPSFFDFSKDILDGAEIKEVKEKLTVLQALKSLF